MKKLIIIAILLLTSSIAYSQNKNSNYCPKTKMVTDCLKCHTVPNFKIIESGPDEENVYPIPNMRIIDKKGYLFLKKIDDEEVMKFLNYLESKKINYAVIEIHSPGGGLFEASRAVNLMSHWESKGRVIETRVYGFALSGGFMLFLAGTKGYRFVSPYADLMWHEINTIEMFAIKISTPSDKEEEARILRHLQNVRNTWIASRCKLTKEELDEKIKKREFWITGKEAIQYGFADGFIK